MDVVLVLNSEGLTAGFFVDVCVLTGSNAPEVMNMKSLADDSDQETSGFGESEQSDSVDETENLMLKMKFLPYKVMPCKKFLYVE